MDRLLAQAAKPSIAPGKEKLLVRSLVLPTTKRRSPCSIRGSRRSNTSTCARTCPRRPASTRRRGRCTIEGEVNAPTTLTLDELKKMPPATITATLECAGNGRAFFDPPVAGIQWAKGRDRHCAVDGRAHGGRAEARRRQERRPLRHDERRRSPLGTMPDFIRQVPIEKAHAGRHAPRVRDERAADPGAARLPAARDRPRLGGRVFGEVAHQLRVLDKEFDGFWVATGYRYPTRRVAPGADGRSEGHGAAHRPRREVADHEAARRRRGAARQASTSPASPGPARSTSRASTCPRIPARPGSRHGSPASRRSTRGGDSSSPSTRRNPSRISSCRAPPTPMAARSR